MKVEEDTKVEEVVRKFPSTIDVFMKFDIKPIKCGDVVWSTVGEEADKVGIDVKELIQELNNTVKQSKGPLNI